MNAFSSLIFHETSTTKQYGLGFEVVVSPGALAEIIALSDSSLSASDIKALAGDTDATLIYVYNDVAAATAFARGDCVYEYITSGINYVRKTAAGTVLTRPAVKGFAQWAIPSGHYSFVVKQGVCFAKADDTGADQKGKLLLTGYITAGCVDALTAPTTYTEAAGILGVGLENAAATIGAAFLARVSV